MIWERGPLAVIEKPSSPFFVESFLPYLRGALYLLVTGRVAFPTEWRQNFPPPRHWRGSPGLGGGAGRRQHLLCF